MNAPRQKAGRFRFVQMESAGPERPGAYWTNCSADAGQESGNQSGLATDPVFGQSPGMYVTATPSALNFHPETAIAVIEKSTLSDRHDSVISMSAALGSA